MKFLIHRDQIHGDVYYDPLSIALLDSKTLQRLGRIYQLGFAHLVYRGGTHTRLSHVMGVAFIAEKLVSSLKKNYEISTKANCLPIGAILPTDFLPKSSLVIRNNEFIEERWEILSYLVKWSALLHDIGHIPFGHTLEDEFSGIYEKHDHYDSPRINFLWNSDQKGNDSEIKKIFLSNEGLLPDSFRKLNISAKHVWQAVMLICLYKRNVERKESDKSFKKMYLEFFDQHNNKLFNEYMADIVADTICADYIDYLQRDTLNVGLDSVKEKRIIQSYFIGKDKASGNLRMALSLVDKGGKPKLSVCTAAKNMVRHRFDLAEIIYYHKTKVSASAMLAKVFSLIDKPSEIGFPQENIEILKIASLAQDLLTSKTTLKDLKSRTCPDYLLASHVGDETLLLMLIDKSWNMATESIAIKDEVKLSNSLLSISLLQGIMERKLYKVIISLNSSVIGKLIDNTQSESLRIEIDKIIKRYRSISADKSFRDQLEEEMASAAGFPSGSFLIYVPGRKVQAKGIETGALDDNGDVIELGAHDTVSEDVEMLNTAYSNLWRFLIYVHPNYIDNNVELSCAFDKMLEVIFPTIDKDEVVGSISKACWFTYIPTKKRKAASLLKEFMNEDSNEIDWKLFVKADTTSIDEINSEESAQRSFILHSMKKLDSNIKNEKLLLAVKDEFNDSKKLNKQLELYRTKLTASESKKGIPDLENSTRILEMISKDLFEKCLRNSKNSNEGIQETLFDS